MGKIVHFMHMSLDGYVAGINGEMDWINVDEEIFDYVGDRTNTADTALYGRVTYDMMEGYWPTAADSPTASKHDLEHSAWYNKVQKVVVSRSMKGQHKAGVTIVSDSIEKDITSIKTKAGKDIIIFGSPSAGHALMSLGLVDELWLFVNPVLLGEGIPMFKGVKDRVKLKLVLSKQFASGVICLQYEKIDD